MATYEPVYKSGDLERIDEEFDGGETQECIAQDDPIRCMDFELPVWMKRADTAETTAWGQSRRATFKHMQAEMEKYRETRGMPY